MDIPNSSIDIFTVSETWLTHNTEDKLTSIANYSLLRHDRQTLRPNGTTKSGGGLGVYYKKHLDVDANIFKHLNTSNGTLEAQWVVINRPHNKKILLGNMYRPPEGSITHAFDLISKALDKVPNLHKYEMLILGDLNANDDKTNTPTYQCLRRFEAEYQIIQTINEPTRHTKTNKSTIDLAFTNIKHISETGVLNYNISDHKAIFVVKKKLRNYIETTTYIGRSYREFTYEKLENKLRSLNLNEVIYERDPNKCYDILEKLVDSAADELCPLTEMRIRVNSVEYLNAELLELQKDRDYFVHKAEVSQDPGDWFIAECLKRKARSENERARSNYFQNLAESLNQNPKKIWNEVQQMEPKQAHSIQNIDKNETGERIPMADLPEHINNYFINIGEELANKFTRIENDQKTFKPDMNNTKYELPKINKDEIIAKLTKISRDKATGVKNINATFLISAIQILIEEYTHLYNLVLTQGIYPDKWKIATVTPIPKIANPKLCGDLRPISILPLPGKIFEQIVSENIKDHLETTGYLVDQQNGFRKNRSTTKSLAILIDEIAEGIDKGEIAVTVFLDFKKAFDTVDHQVLLWKLNVAGLGTNTCKLLKNYLTNRKQATKLHNTTSSLQSVKTGVPQGSTLGPLMFILFLNDLPKVSNIPLFTLFADDASITVRDRDIGIINDKLNTVLKQINLYCNENMLTLNTKKTEYVIFASKANKKRIQNFKLKIGTETLREVETYQYLGTSLDSMLNGTKQLSKLNRHLAIKLTSFRKIRNCMSERTASMFYKATILPIFDYNDIIYKLLTKQQQTKIQRIQNRALRIVYKGKNLPVKEMHRRSELDYLECRRYHHLMALMYNRTKDTKYIDRTVRITRRAGAKLLTVPKPKTNKLKKVPIYNGSTMWNKLPVKVRNAGSKLTLKNLLKKHLADEPPEWTNN